MKSPIILSTAYALLVIAFVPVLMAASPEDSVANRIRSTLGSRYPDVKVIDVRPSPMPSIFEVFTGKEIFYTDESADFMLAGSLVDTRTKKDVTAEEIDVRNAIDFSALPFHQAIKIVKGNGKRKLAMFTDPDCPYCQALERELRSVTDVTIYAFLFPLTQIHPHAAAHAEAIWCSDDQAKAWTDWMLEKKEPASKNCSTNPVVALNVLGKSLHLVGTPTLYFESGRRVSHGMKAPDLEQSLNEASQARATIRTVSK